MITTTVLANNRITNIAKRASYEKIVEVVSFYHCDLKLLTRQKGILIVPKEHIPTPELDGLLFKVEHHVPVPNPTIYINEQVTGMLNEEVRAKIMRNEIVDGRVRILYYVHVGARQLSKLVKNKSYYVPEADMCVSLITADVSDVDFPMECTHEASYETPPEYGYNSNLNIRLAYRTKNSVKELGVETPMGQLVLTSKPNLNMKEGLYVSYGNSKDNTNYAYIDTLKTNDTDLAAKGISLESVLNNVVVPDVTKVSFTEADQLRTKLQQVDASHLKIIRQYSELLPLQNKLLNLVALLSDAKQLKEKEAIMVKIDKEISDMDASTSSSVLKLLMDVIKNI